MGTQLRNDFTWDVMSQVCDEWRLRRGAILRWVRGWYAQYGLADLPAAIAHLAEVDPEAAQRRAGRADPSPS